MLHVKMDCPDGKSKITEAKRSVLELRVPFYQANGSRRLLAEDKPRRGDGIAANIVDSATAPIQDVTNVRRVAIEIAKRADD